MMGWNLRNRSQTQILPSFTCSPQGFVTQIAVWWAQCIRSSRDSLTDRVKGQSVSGPCLDPLTPTWHHSSPLPCTVVKRNCWNISELLHVLPSLALSVNICNPSLRSADMPYYAPSSGSQFPSSVGRLVSLIMSKLGETFKPPTVFQQMCPHPSTWTIPSWLAFWIS